MPKKKKGKNAQQRPGREPRRHPGPRRSTCPRRRAQQRPGREPRRHLRLSRQFPGKSPALNKGRGVNPGDTAGDPARRGEGAVAQQRPGREPRRHAASNVMLASPSRTLNKGRGVNPGDTTASAPMASRTIALNKGRGVNPGDTSPSAAQPGAAHPAQQRPGREPRRHAADRGGGGMARARSTKAGA